jgi:hypothetical protein
MLPIRFEDIGPDDILRLIEDKISERKILEYKQALTFDGKEDRAEFLADVSSFANASGGDIVFGISELRDGNEKTGIPEAITPLQVGNPMTECTRIEQIVESGIQPRIPVVQVKYIDIPEQGFVILVRIGKSWIAPHMVSYANRTRFYSRNGTGKVQLDVQQIGAAFSLQRSIGERLQAWKVERIAKAVVGEGPIPLIGSQILLHFISAAALVDEAIALPRVFDTTEWGNAKNLISDTANLSRYNADGLLLALDGPSKGDKQSYLQIFKDSRLEYGDTYQLDNKFQEVIASKIFENAIVDTFSNALHLLSILEVPEPIFVTLTLIGMKGRQMALPVPPYVPRKNDFTHGFDREIISCPDVRIENLSEGRPYQTTLLPILNSIWQAAGLKQSPYIDKDGIWNP